MTNIIMYYCILQYVLCAWIRHTNTQYNISSMIEKMKSIFRLSGSNERQKRIPLEGSVYCNNTFLGYLILESMLCL